MKNNRFSSKKLIRCRVFIYSAAIFILFFSAGCILYTSVKPAAAATGGIFLVLMLLFINNRVNDRYNDDLIENLSLLAESMIDMQYSDTIEYPAIFDENVDSLTSRLQEQIQKLSRILHRQNMKISQEQNRIKTLISDISHQIKTPVASVKMFGELLSDPNVTDDERAEYSEILQKSLDKLTFLSDGMIKMSRLESGIIKLKPEKTDVSELIFQAASQVQHAAKKKRICLTVEEIHSGQIFCDRNWTTEALVNILDNAVKYTPDNGKVEVSLQDYPSYYCIKISDSGAGIQESEYPLIFQRFYRGRQAVGQDGIGLGLYLSRKIILDQSGYIKVSSNENGSDFFVFLKKED